MTKRDGSKGRASAICITGRRRFEVPAAFGAGGREGCLKKWLQAG